MESDTRGPDFVCIGAQKGGTTWLYDNLYSHPQVWLPPVKEIHFFNSLCPNIDLLGVETAPHYGLGERAKLVFKELSVSNIRWNYRFFHHEKTTNWYLRLFELNNNKITGDFTPAYSTLDQRGVEYARSVLKPDCKVFVILRNPIERIWSGIKMENRWHNVDSASIETEQLIRQLETPTNRLRTDYLRILPLWQSAFKENFQIFLYDDLCDAPEHFLNSVEDFIGVDRWSNADLLGKRSNADTRSIAANSELKEFLAQRYEAEIKKLEQWVPGIVVRWLS